MGQEMTWLEAAARQFVTITESHKSTRVQQRASYDVLRAAIDGRQIDLNESVEAMTMKKPEAK